MKVFPTTILFFLIALLSFSCKSDSINKVKSGSEILNSKNEDRYSKSSDVSKEIRIIKNMKDELNSQMIEAMQVEAKAILAHRFEDIGMKSWRILTHPIWEYEFIFDGQNMSNPGEHKGRWIKFDDDLTYEYGHFEDTDGAGKYHYDIDTNLLLLLDNNPKIKPNEYQVKMANNVCILIGNDVYRDNNFQCKLAGIPQKPTNN